MSLPPRLRARFERVAEEDRHMSRAQKDELAALLPDGRVLFDEQMSKHSAISVGGPGEAFVTIADVDELKRVLSWAVEHNIEFRFFGKGSKMIVRDKGVKGIILSLGESFNQVWIERTCGNEVFIGAGAATKARDIFNFTREKNLAGVAEFANERGSLGGFLSSGAGVNANELMAAIEEITIVTKDGRELTLRRNALRVENGRLKIPRTTAIVRAIFKCTQATVQEVLPLGDEANAEAKALPKLTGVFSSMCRTPARELIEDAGLMGVRVGGARVSLEDANTIINQGNASTRDIAVLVNLMRDRVREQTGVNLEPMIELIGER